MYQEEEIESWSDREMFRIAVQRKLTVSFTSLKKLIELLHIVLIFNDRWYTRHRNMTEKFWRNHGFLTAFELFIISYLGKPISINIYSRWQAASNNFRCSNAFFLFLKIWFYFSYSIYPKKKKKSLCSSFACGGIGLSGKTKTIMNEGRLEFYV